MSDSTGTVIIGGGIAAAHTAARLRELEYENPVTIIADEHTVPYERPPLSKDYLQGASARSDAYVHESGWYAEHAVDLRQEATAEAIDREQGIVRLSTGARIPYEHLVLATGARPRIPDLPGVGLPNVMTLRRIEDAEKLRRMLERGGRLVVVGAGWIGMEVASSARASGVEVTVVAPGDVPLQKALGHRLGEHFAALHRAGGVDLRMGTSVSGISEGRDARLVVTTSGGRIDADAVLLATGAVPAVGLAERAGLDVADGIVTDSALRTSDPGILAAGDVAAAEHASLGRVRIEHWDDAIRQGRLAATTIVGGEDARYDWQPYFFTDQFGLGMEYVGLSRPDDEVVVRGDVVLGEVADESGGEFLAFWLRDGAVTAAMNVNIWDVNDDLRALIGSRIAPERLADPAVPLGDLA